MSELSGLRVLVVDDDEMTLKVMSATLHGLGLKDVMTVDSGEKVLDLIEARDRHFDVILCDLNLPDIDGMMVVRHLAGYRFPGAIIFISGEDRRILKGAVTLAKALEMRVAGALEKPVTRPELASLLSRVYSTNPCCDYLGCLPDISAAQLAAAMDAGEIETFYQPQVDIHTRRAVSAEALVRWRSPELGVVPPTAFVGVAEDSGLIDPMFEIVAQQAFEATGQWHREGIPIKIGVNMSVRNLEDLGLPERIQGWAQANGLANADVTLEVTESQLMAEFNRPLEILSRLSMMRFQLSIDDFGTNYSSMEKLATFPFHELKIDRAFVNGATADGIARTIMEMSVYLGKKLEMKIVAEGVEDQEDWIAVAAAGADLVQGYFVAKPMSRSDFGRWLRESEFAA